MSMWLWPCKHHPLTTDGFSTIPQLKNPRCTLHPACRVPAVSRQPLRTPAALVRRHLSLRVQAAEPAAAGQATERLPLSALKPGQEMEGRVVREKQCRSHQQIQDVLSNHLTPFSPLPRNPQVKVEQFGAFVNIGAVKDGLVHISQLSVSLGSSARKKG